jgi:hypothetical protein
MDQGSEFGVRRGSGFGVREGPGRVSSTLRPPGYRLPNLPGWDALHTDREGVGYLARQKRRCISRAFT